MVVRTLSPVLAALALSGTGWLAAARAQEALPDTPLLRIAADAPPKDDAARMLADEDRKANGNGNGNGNGDKKDDEKKEEPPKNISDNSFLIEEAYNQEPGVAQHIFNWVNFWDRQGGKFRDFTFAYTMELPLFSQKHQFSWVLPMLNLYEQPDGGAISSNGGFGDMLLNYRYQLSMEDEHGWRPAIAPRATVILPTGDRNRGTGSGETGLQIALPVSKQTEHFAFHFNAGYTYVPNTAVPLDFGLESPGRDLHSYYVGGSIIYLMSYHFNLMLETLANFNQDLADDGSRQHLTEVIINPGFRWAVYTSDDVQWVLGASVPIGVTRDAPDIGVFGYMSVEHTFRKVKKKDGD